MNSAIHRGGGGGGGETAAERSPSLIRPTAAAAIYGLEYCILNQRIGRERASEMEKSGGWKKKKKRGLEAKLAAAAAAAGKSTEEDLATAKEVAAMQYGGV